MTLSIYCFDLNKVNYINSLVSTQINTERKGLGFESHQENRREICVIVVKIKRLRPPYFYFIFYFKKE